jgi:hypothetical protein
MTSRRLSRRLRVALGRVVPMAYLILLACAAWGVTAYVCGRQAGMLSGDGARMLMRQVLPGIW